MLLFARSPCDFDQELNICVEDEQDEDEAPKKRKGANGSSKVSFIYLEPLSHTVDCCDVGCARSAMRLGAYGVELGVT